MNKKTLRAVSVLVVMVFLVLAVFSLSACSAKKNIIGTFYGIGYSLDGKITELIIKFINKTDILAYTHIAGNSPVIQTGTYWISENKVMLDDVFDDGEIIFEYDKKANSLSTDAADIVLNKLSKEQELEIITQINVLMSADDSLKKPLKQMEFEQAEKVKIIENALLKGTIVAVNPVSVCVKVPLSYELLALSKQEPDAMFKSGGGLDLLDLVATLDKYTTLIEITSTDYRLLAYGVDKLTIENAIQNNSQLGWCCIGIDRA